MNAQFYFTDLESSFLTFNHSTCPRKDLKNCLQDLPKAIMNGEKYYAEREQRINGQKTDGTVVAYSESRTQKIEPTLFILTEDLQRLSVQVCACPDFTSVIY